jgi:histone deacetylase 1/2
LQLPLRRFGINGSATQVMRHSPSSPTLQPSNAPSSSDGLCHAFQLGRHVRLPFHSSSRACHVFQLLHCDLWTTPITSVSGHKYYLVILDDYSHYLWAFPLRLKSNTFPTLSNFFAYVNTQFGVPIQGLQSDSGREFDNHIASSFFAIHGVLFRMSCPYTSAQNGKAKRIIRTINNDVRSLLFHACVPPFFWAAAVNKATQLLNILPTKTLSFSTPHFALFGVHKLAHYPNLSATTAHKLAPRSTLCVFLSYSPHHKGYVCLDHHTNHTIISCHVVFDETSFPFAEDSSPPLAEALDFFGGYF